MPGSERNHILCLLISSAGTKVEESERVSERLNIVIKEQNPNVTSTIRYVGDGARAAFSTFPPLIARQIAFLWLALTQQTTKPR